MANMLIGKIHRTHILDTYQEMQENGTGNGSRILIHKVLNAMFNYGESEDMVRRNYAKECMKELGIYNNKRDAWTMEQQKCFPDFVETSQELSWYCKKILKRY